MTDYEDIGIHPQDGMVHLQTDDLEDCLEFTWPDALDLASHLLTAAAQAASDAGASPEVFKASMRAAIRDARVMQ